MKKGKGVPCWQSLLQIQLGLYLPCKTIEMNDFSP